MFIATSFRFSLIHFSSKTNNIKGHVMRILQYKALTTTVQCYAVNLGKYLGIYN